MDTTAKFHGNIMAILMNNLFKESDFGRQAILSTLSICVVVIKGDEKKKNL